MRPRSGATRRALTLFSSALVRNCSPWRICSWYSLTPSAPRTAPIAPAGEHIAGDERRGPDSGCPAREQIFKDAGEQRCSNRHQIRPHQPKEINRHQAEERRGKKSAGEREGKVGEKAAQKRHSEWDQR